MVFASPDFRWDDILVANVNQQAKKPAKGGISFKKGDSKVRKCRPPRRAFGQIKSDFVTKMPPQMGLKRDGDFKSYFPAEQCCLMKFICKFGIWITW